jgi:hypothetical protein
MTRWRIALLAPCLAVLLVTLLADGECGAQEHSIIKQPGDHPHYIFEAEPHGVLGLGDPFFPYVAPGLGFRGTFHIADGFVKTINDSVGVGFGIDVTTSGNVVVPVVMQWNFWLSTHWSVFGEPGIAIGGGPRVNPGSPVWPAFFFGGRYHFNDRIALTMRIGFPYLSVGASFFL